MGQKRRCRLSTWKRCDRGLLAWMRSRKPRRLLSGLRLARSIAIDATTGFPMRDSRGGALYDWRLRGLLRFPLRTPYTEVARKAAKIAALRELRPQPRVVVDATGVGTACVELIRTAMRPYPDIEVWGISITSGESYRVVARHSINCSKVQLVGSFREVLEMSRFRVCRRHDGGPIRGAEVLKRELSAFRVRVSRASNEVFGAEAGQHDDCVLSVSLPVWAGSLPWMRMRERFDGEDDPAFRVREHYALTREDHKATEEEKIRAAEWEAMGRERYENELAHRREAEAAKRWREQRERGVIDINDPRLWESYD